MLRGVAPLALAVLTVGCAREAARPAEPRPPATPEMDAAPREDLVATCTDPRPAIEIREATQRCARHYRDMANGAAVIEYGEACADVYSAPSCREALRATTAARLSDESLLAAAQACRDAYCPRLEDPKPPVCNGFPSAIDDPTGAWDDLFTAILACDYDSMPDARLFASSMSPFKILSLGVNARPGNSP